MHANYMEVQQLPYGVRSAQKGFKTMNFESISSCKLRDVDSDGK